MGFSSVMSDSNDYSSSLNLPLENASNFYVVGIGASAGGLRALEDFFDHMLNDSNAAFVVVQHLSPDFKSLMKELLERHTQMVIHRVEEGMPLQPNHVYLIPPRMNLTVKERRLHIVEQETNQRFHPNFPISLFFESLAQDCKDKAIGVVLSGTGNDGSQGLQAISENGGLSLVQSPATAEFDGMPQSAIATGIVNQVLPPAQLAELIGDAVRGQQTYSNKGVSAEADLDGEQLQKIIDILNEG
jgi:chemotaxis response regulator CheB